MRILRCSPLFRNIFAVASGAAAGQVIAFAFSPLITRIYTPEIFGLQGVFLSLISILSPVVALRYPLAIVVAGDEADIRNLARLSVLIAFTFSGVLGLTLLVAQRPVLALLGAEALGSLIWFLPLALFCVALQDVASYRATRFAHFRAIGISTVVQAFLVNLARVLGGLLAPVAGVLVAVTSVAPVVQAAMLAIDNRRRRRFATQLRWPDVRALLRKHRDFPCFRVPTDVLNAASQSVPVILLAALFSPTAAGLYTLTRSVLILPVNLVSVAIGNVLYGHFADLDRAGEPLLPILLRWTVGLLALTPPLIGLAWFAPSAFAFIFGEEWRQAGYYAGWMAPWMGISIANVPTIRIAPVVKAQMVMLVANIVTLILRILSILLVYWMGYNDAMAVASFSMTGLASNIILVLVLLIAVRKYESVRKLALPHQ